VGFQTVVCFLAVTETPMAELQHFRSFLKLDVTLSSNYCFACNLFLAKASPLNYRTVAEERFGKCYRFQNT